MIHYHGTPVGGVASQVPRFLAGRNALVSYFNPADIGVAREVCSSYVIDNGAFSAWRSGKPITEWSGYYRFLELYLRDPSCRWAVIPDVIDGTEDDNDRLIREWPFGNMGIPVWHMHESLDRLLFLSISYRTVAIGSSGQFSSPGSRTWWVRMDLAMRVLCNSDGKPSVKIHGMRMLDPRIFSKLPFASADSTNACRNASRKAKQCRCSRVQGAAVIADRIEAVQSALTYKFMTPLETQI